MTSGPHPDETVEAYLQAVVEGNGRAGIRLALGLVDRGVPSDEVIVNLLAAAQHEVGERWLRNEWGVADEHLASGITQKALDAVANTFDPPAVHGLVVVACAGGDWHSLPAQMFAEVLRSHGFDIAFLGASTPVDHVSTYLARKRPDALALTCSLPLFYAGVTRLANAAHAQGIPVIAGGRALGDRPGRATRLGADAWAARIADAATILRAWECERPTILSEPAAFDAGAVLLDLSAVDIATAAFESLSAAHPWMAAYNDHQLARTKEDLAFIIQFIAAARLVDDPTVLSDFLDWLRTILGYRGVPRAAMDAGLSALAPLVARADAAAGQLALEAFGLQ